MNLGQQQTPHQSVVISRLDLHLTSVGTSRLTNSILQAIAKASYVSYDIS